MTDLTQRIITALRRAVISARNADEAAEAGALADALEAPVIIPEPPPVSNEFVAPGATPFAHLPDDPQKAQELAPPMPETVHTS